MGIKLIAFDLDGTTIVKHKYLPECNRSALLEAHSLGAILVPATGRMRDFLPECVKELPIGYAITSNGGVVYDMGTGRAVIENLIPNGAARAVQKILDGYDVYLEYYTGGGAITRRDMPGRARSHYGLPESKRHFVEDKVYSFTDDFGAMLRETGFCPEKINLPYLPEGLREEIWERLSEVEGLRLTSSIPDNIEINSAEAHKGGALGALCGRLGIPMGEVLALGDNGNDVTMLRAAGISAAMGDGSGDAKAAATFVTAAHDECGLAQAVRKVFEE